MGDIQHRPMPLATIYETQQPLLLNHSHQLSPFTLNPACEAFAPRYNFMDLPDSFYELPLRAAALFSTCNGRAQKRGLPNPPPMRVIRSDIAKDLETKFITLWDRHRLQLYNLQPLTRPEDLYLFFDAVDLYVEGVEFCWKVVARLSEHAQQQMYQTHVQIDRFARQWIQDNGSFLGHLHPGFDIVSQHADFCADSLSHFEHEEDVLLLRRAINHYFGEFYGYRRSAEDSMMRLQNQLHSRGFQDMHIQASYPTTTTQLFMPYNYQNGRHDIPRQYSRDRRLSTQKEPAFQPGSRARGWSIESDRRGGGARYHRDQRGSRTSPLHGQPGYQRKFSDSSTIRETAGQDRSSSILPGQLGQTINQHIDMPLSGSPGEGSEVVTNQAHNGNITFTYDGECKEDDLIKQIPLTVFVKNFETLPQYFENHELKRLFSQCGQVVAVSYVIHTPVPFAFIQFKNSSSVSEAIRKFHGYNIASGVQLFVKHKRQAGKLRLGSGSGVSNYAYPIHRRDSIKERQSNSLFPTDTSSDLSQPHPELNGREPTLITAEHQMPLARIENLLSAVRIKQDTHANAPCRKENSPRQETGPSNTKSKRKDSTQLSTISTTLPSRLNARSSKLSENQQPRCGEDAQHQQKVLRVTTEGKNKENQPILESVSMNPAFAGDSKKKSKKNSYQKQKKKKLSKSDGGYPESHNASFCTDASSDSFSPLHPFSPTSNKASTANSSLSIGSSKGSRVALSDSGKARNYPKVKNVREVGSVKQDFATPGTQNPEFEMALGGLSAISDENLTMHAKKYQGHLKKDSSISATFGSSIRKTDARNLSKKVVSIRKATIPSVERFLSDLEAPDVIAPKSHLEEVELKEIHAQELPLRVPSTRLKEVEPSVSEVVEPVSPSPELEKSSSVNSNDGRILCPTLTSPPAPESDKKKARSIVAVPLNFLGRPQPSVTNHATLSNDLDKLGSETWPYVRSCRPL